jgi:hypothetical protein
MAVVASASSKRHGGHSSRSWGTLIIATAIGLVVVTLVRYYEDATAGGYSSLTLLAGGGATAAKTKRGESLSQNDLVLDGLQTPAMREQMLASCPKNLHLTTNAAMNHTAFIDKTFDALLRTQVKEDPLVYVARNFAKFAKERGALPAGFWAEFGVFKGNSLIQQHGLLRDNGGGTTTSGFGFKGVMAGFDSFQGLPEDWRTTDKGKDGAPGMWYKKGTFSTPYDETRKKVPADVLLYKGWFQNSIIVFLQEYPSLPASFIHHDGDLFVSTTITFQLLGERIVPGTVMCFDELFGYPGFKDHEILALYLWMQQYHATLCPLAAWWPSPAARPSLKDNNMAQQARAPFQAACFQVLDLGMPSQMIIDD